MSSSDQIRQFSELRAKRDNLLAESIHKKIGTNRVPEDDETYVEDANTIRASISYIVSQSMM